MPRCLITGCRNNAENNLGIRCRRPATTAIWAPNCNAYLCNEHADLGYSIHINLTLNNSNTITTIVSAGGRAVSRTTPINHSSEE